MKISAPRRIVIIGVITAIVLASAVGGFFIIEKNPELRLELLQKPLFQFFLHTFRSFRKLADIPYLVWEIAPDSLQTYELAINLKNLGELNASLPDDPIKGRLTDDNKIQVNAVFKAGEFSTDIKIRYRGWAPNHWNALKKSYLIQFPNEKPFDGVRELNLIIPEDRAYAVEALNMYRAEKLGLFAPKPWFVNLKVNGQEMGVYMAIAHWDKNFLEREKKSDSSNIFGTKDLSSKDLKEINFYDPKTIELWKDYTKNSDTNPGDIESLQEFLNFITYSPNGILERTLPIIIDMDDFYAWMIINTLASSNHQSARGNIVILRDTTTGKFSYIPWDVSIYNPQNINLETHPLIGRVLSIESFREEFMGRLKNYVLDEENLKDDLKFYDDVTSSIKPALFKDQAKLPLDYEVSRDFTKYRKLAEENFVFLSNIFKTGRENELFEGEYKIQADKNYELPPFLKEASRSASEFLSEHPQFYLKDLDTIALGPGEFTFTETIIMPASFDFEIKPGTTILMGEGVSLVSFKKIVANGTSLGPIKIFPLTTKPWGSVLLLGNGEKSEIKYAYFSGGSGFNHYGIFATGMLALHNSDAEVSESRFENSFDDDALNVKNGSVLIENNAFQNTFSDAIDLDASEKGKVYRNKFTNIGTASPEGGDAIDISFSKVEISENDIETCGDKGISVGEASMPVILNNAVTKCAIGISVKDLSEAKIENNTFSENKIGLEIKQKKPLFGGGKVWLKNSVFRGNEIDLAVDELSILLENVNNRFLSI